MNAHPGLTPDEGVPAGQTNLNIDDPFGGSDEGFFNDLAAEFAPPAPQPAPESQYAQPDQQSAPEQQPSGGEVGQPAHFYGVPVKEEEPSPGTSAPKPEQPEDNDQKRYQYWQSQAAKRENELKEKEQKLAELEEKLKSVNGGKQPEDDDASVPEMGEILEFPPPPAAPQMPMNFSLQDAAENPESASAQYMYAKHQWDQEMAQYTYYQNQYQTNLLRAEREERAEAERARANAAKTAQAERAAEQAAIKYAIERGVPADKAPAFVEFLRSTPNTDALFRYWAMDAGLKPVDATSQPSPEFQQRQRTSMIPPDAGVVPDRGANGQFARPEDAIWAGMQELDRGSNPFE